MQKGTRNSIKLPQGLSLILYHNQKILLCSVLVICMSIVLITTANAAKIALVVGNSNYKELTDLRNPLTDVEAYQTTLKKLGFQVHTRFNVGYEEFADTLEILSDQASVGDTIAFFYSGHGWSDGTSNFLIPVDAPAEGSDRKLRRNAIELRNGRDGVLDVLEESGAKLVFAVIDACRDNPFQSDGRTRSTALSRGLAPIEPNTGTYVVFSAGEGQQALDSLPNDPPDLKLSLFARHFIPELDKGIDLRRAVQNARAQTAHDARKHYDGHKQIPAIYDQVIETNICLSGQCISNDGQTDISIGLGSLGDALVEPDYQRKITALEKISSQYSGSVVGSEAQKLINRLKEQRKALRLPTSGESEQVSHILNRNLEAEELVNIALKFRRGTAEFPRDRQAMKELYLAAAEKGSVDANYELGTIFAKNSSEADKNLKLAYYHLKRAYDAGHGEAAYEIARILDIPDWHIDEPFLDKKFSKLERDNLYFTWLCRAINSLDTRAQAHSTFKIKVMLNAVNSDFCQNIFD